MRNREDLKEAILHGAVKRVRPKVMTVACAFFGLVPIMWSTGAGADVMKRIAAPMIGGLFTSFLMELLVYPAVYLLWKWHGGQEGRRSDGGHRSGVPAARGLKTCVPRAFAPDEPNDAFTSGGRRSGSPNVLCGGI